MLAFPTLLLCSLLVTPAWSAEPKILPDFELVDLTGKKHNPAAAKDNKIVVYVYVSIDCPIANFYQPTLRKLAQKFEKQGVRFYQIHSDPDLTPKAARKHTRDFNVVSPVILDPTQKLARAYKAKVTPEVHAITRDGSCIYRGRIDDTYAALGKRRPKPTTRDLEAALTASLAGKKIEVPVTEAIGCQIFIED